VGMCVCVRVSVGVDVDCMEVAWGRPTLAVRGSDGSRSGVKDVRYGSGMGVAWE
jgi:hypothetical protein